MQTLIHELIAPLERDQQSSLPSYLSTEDYSLDHP